jgi:hypothetical protein
MQICHFNTMFGAHQVEDVILFIFKFSKFIVFIFKLFQSPKLIKYVFNFFHVIVFCKLL